MVHQLPCLILFVTLHLLGIGQTARIEALRKNISVAKGNDETLEAYILLFEEYQSINRDSLDIYGPVIKQLREKSKNTRLKSLAQLAYANWYFRWGWSDSALVFIEPELANNPVEDPDSRDIYFKLSRAKAYYLGAKSRYAEALDVLYAIMPEAEKYKDSLTLGLSLNTIGSIAMARSKPDEALQWVRKAVFISGKPPGNPQVLAPAYLNMGNIFAQLGNFDSAFYYVQKALPLCKALENLNYTATGLRILSNVHLQRGEFKEAEDALLKMMEVRRKTSPASILVEDNIQLATFYANTNQLERAIDICLKNLRKGSLMDAASDSIIVLTNDPKIRLTFLEALAGYYKKAGKINDYISSLEELVAVKDSFYEANSAQKIAELQTQYDVKSKENTILKQKYDLQRKNLLIYSTAALTVLLFLGSMYWFRHYRRRQQKRAIEMLEEEKSILLEAVRQAEEKERVRIALDLHDNLGAYAASMSANIGYLHMPEAPQEIQLALKELNNNASSIVSQLNDTIWVLKKDALPLTAIGDRIKKFIQSLAKSYPEVRIDVLEDIQDDLVFSSSQAFHLYRILQEGINNALKHSNGNIISIFLAASGVLWHVSISDDGVGMPGKGIFKEGKGGFGLNNMKERAQENGWDIQWKKNDKGGTTVTIGPTTN